MVKELIKKVADHKPRHFIAPVMSRKAKLFTVQDGVPYWFYTQVEYPNWYYLMPHKAKNRSNKPTATVVRQANPHEYIDYLRRITRLPSNCPVPNQRYGLVGDAVQPIRCITTRLARRCAALYASNNG